MNRTRLSCLAFFALAAPMSAYGAKPPKLPVCDANPKHRRPANPYGTVLPVATTSAPGAAAPATAPTPAPTPPPAKTSAVSPSTYYASC